MDTTEVTDIRLPVTQPASMSPADEDCRQEVQIAEQKGTGQAGGKLESTAALRAQPEEAGEDDGVPGEKEGRPSRDQGRLIVGETENSSGSQYDTSDEQSATTAVSSVSFTASSTAPSETSTNPEAVPSSQHPGSDQVESSSESDSESSSESDSESSGESDSGSDTDSIVSKLEDLFDFGDDHSLGCQCGVRVEGSVNAANEDDLADRHKISLLEDLRKANPGMEEVLRRLHEREAEAWNEMEKKASAIGTILLTPAEITIHADEGGKGDAELTVPLQVKYTGIAPAILSSLADISCAALGLNGVLIKLNEVLRTNYTSQSPGLVDVLQSFIDCDCDFGTAYGQLRPFWFSDHSILLDRLEQMKRTDAEKRQSVLDMELKQVKQMDFPPRRVWDLYSNRVVPWWAFCQDYTLYHDPPRTSLPPLLAVSHSWMEETLRHNVDTSINGHEWPVPIPVDASLEQVRVELLNHGAQYAWLDVMCLRQFGDEAKEPIRKQEWGLDVPIIGSIYRYFGKTITYFSGLGRPFYTGNLSSVRHWMNRAWTLQEAKRDTIMGGLVSDSPFPPALQDGHICDPQVNKFYDLFTLCQGKKLLFHALESMQKRAAVNDLDKIAGLAYCTGYPERLRPLVLYKVQDGTRAALEEAWSQLVETLDPTADNWAHCLFLYPAPGDFGHTWRPSWHQTQTTLLPSLSASRLTGLDDNPVKYSVEDRHFRCSGYLLAKCTVKGLAETNSDGYCRMGTIKVRHGGSKHKFYISAHHQQPIDEGSYCLMSNRFLSFWVVGRMTETDTLEKVSVIETEWDDDDKLKKIAEWATVKLV